MADLSTIYQARFSQTGLGKRERVWRALCSSFFQRKVGPNKTVLDLACGYGDFINHIEAKAKFAVDLNPDAKQHLSGDIQFSNAPATDLGSVPDEALDVVFTSNFLEHLPDKTALDAVFLQVHKKLKPGGKFIVLGPNIKYAYREYWDFYDHYIPLSHLSLAEGLSISGFSIEEVIPKFLPFTMNNATPAHPLLVKAYLRLPIAWKVMGKQFLVIARKDS